MAKDLMSSRTPLPVKRIRSHRAGPVLGCLAILLILVVLFAATRSKPYSTWPSASGRVVNTRIVLTDFHNSGEARPGQIYYVGEAQVVYTAKGEQRTAWMPVTDKADNRDWLAFQLSQRVDDEAEVKWDPSNPSHAIAKLNFRR